MGASLSRSRSLVLRSLIGLIGSVSSTLRGGFGVLDFAVARDSCRLMRFVEGFLGMPVGFLQLRLQVFVLGLKLLDPLLEILT